MAGGPWVWLAAAIAANEANAKSTGYREDFDAMDYAVGEPLREDVTARIPQSLGFGNSWGDAVGGGTGGDVLDKGIGASFDAMNPMMYANYLRDLV
jgi:hypothetical protein